MTVTVETPIASSVANGVTTVFPHSFTILDADDLVVVGVVGGVTTTYVNGVDYTVSGVGTASGSVTFGVAPASGVIVTRYRDTALSRETDYQQAGDLLAAVVNLDFDRLWQALQDIFNGGKGAPSSLRAPNGETVDPFPDATTRASHYAGFDASGQPTILLPASGTAAALASELADPGNVAFGDAMIAVKRSEANSVARTLHFYVQHSKLLVANYCDPAVDSAAAVATALANAISDAQAGGKVLEFSPGAIYITNAQTTFMTGSGIRNMRFWGNGCTIYRNSGAGPVVTFDSGAFDERNDNHEFIDFVLKGNAASTYALYTRGLARSKLHDIRFVDVAGGMLSELSVLNDYQRLILSDNIDTFTINPTVGIVMDRSAAGFNSAVNNFIDCVMEGPISNVGIDLVNADGNTFVGGVCEAIPRGLVIRAGSSGNNFVGMDFEANSVYDIECFGKRNAFTDCIISSAGSSGTAFIQPGAVGNTIRGGFCRRVNIDAGSDGTRLFGVSFNDNGANGIQGTGDYQSYGCVKVDTNYAQTSLVDDVSGVTGSYTATLTGCTTSPTAAINYRRQGDLVTLEIPSGFTATSNTTACTLTGMPAEIRPTATRSDIGIVTDNSANVIGRFEIDSGGTITLRNGAGAVFTGSGTKGAQASTITYKV